MDHGTRQDHRQPGVGNPQAPDSVGGPPRYAPPPRRSRLTWLWVLLGVLAVGLVVWLIVSHSGPAGGAHGARGGRGGRGGRFGGLPTAVSTAQVAHGDVPIYMNQLGAVTPLATVKVNSQISGYLQQIAFTEGQMVTKGQFLAQIDPRPYQAALQQQEGALARDQAQLAEAQLDLKRYQTLLAQDSIARQTEESQAATVKQLEGTVKTDQANIAAAKLNLIYCHITSPVTGRVGLRQIDVGNYITPGLTNGLVVVTELTPIDVLFTLPEDNLPQIQGRIHAGAVLPVTAYDRSGATELAEGKLLTLDNQIDPTTGTVQAKARFDNGAGTLFPQQFVNVKILVDTLKNAVVAPTSSVLRGADGLFAYVVQGGTNAHTVAVRAIKTGPVDGDKTAILSGLQPGDVVVTDGSDRLRDGASVILPGDCVPSMPQAGGGAGRRGRHGGGSGAHGGAGARGACPGGQQPAGAPAKVGDNSTQQASTPDQGGENRGPGGKTQAMLAQLDLDADQQLKAQALFTTARGEVVTAAAQAGDDPTARRQAYRQAYDKAFDQLNTILRPDQKAKLVQIRAQMAQHQGGGGHGQGGGQ
ncbi:efflux RND transporter periplasmic adaptor subunit [Caulobacter sp. S45]|uniref:efflux RND transporter periplasmic adaptor subunit n=1 Tax=Caulobacter sp. S45 TaxID=1641861 RepID=UPI00131A96C8|nr:efflux RND transporter periplasmic adaptor subunit [Caulobacter sp. S45]